MTNESIDKKKYSNFNNFNDDDYYANKDNYFSNSNDGDDQFDYDILANSINAMIINNMILNNNSNNTSHTNLNSNNINNAAAGSNKFFNHADSITQKLNPNNFFLNKNSNQNNDRQNFNSGRNYANKLLNHTGMTSLLGMKGNNSGDLQIDNDNNVSTNTLNVDGEIAGAESSDPNANNNVTGSSNINDDNVVSNKSDFLINSIFQKFASNSNKDKKQAQIELKTLIQVLQKEYTNEQNFQRFLNVINNQIFELIHSNDSESKLGGILAVDTLIDFYNSNDELPNQISRLANYLRILIPSNDLNIMKQAAKVIGKLCNPGGTISSEFVDFEIKNCLEWLTTSQESTQVNSKQEYKKNAAILLINSIAFNSPYLLYPYVTSILDNIWRALRDNNYNIRLEASITLGKCLHILDTRDQKMTKSWCLKLFKGCNYGFQLNTDETIHGSLLGYKELLKYPTYLQSKFDSFYENTIRYKNFKNDLVRREVYKTFPLLLSFSPKIFLETKFDDVMLFYLEILKNADDLPYNSTIEDNLNSNTNNNITRGLMMSQQQLNSDKACIFVSIGDMAIQTSDHIISYLPMILANIRLSLQIKYKIRKIYEKGIFYCIEKLAYSAGSLMAKHLNKDLLSLMLKCPLSHYLKSTLETLKDTIPAISDKIDELLLDIISFNLSSESFKYPGSPKIISKLNETAARNYRNQDYFRKTGETNTDENDIQILISLFKMIDIVSNYCSLAQFVSKVIIQYIEQDDPLVRKYAALTSCDLLSKDPVCKETSLNSLSLVSDVLGKLLVLALSDTVVDIRLQVLKRLGTNFDPQLSQAENINLLFMALNDESFVIQVEVMKIIGRLSYINPAYIIPYLRKILLQLLTQLKYLTDSRKKEESAKLISVLIKSSADTAKPYIESILEVLLPKARDPSSSVGSTSLEAIGELTTVGGKAILRYSDELMPLIINSFKDQSNPFTRDSALKALGKLAKSSSYVIDPYIEYPDLLDILINTLKNENSQMIKRETVKLIGTLGALDPYKQRDLEKINTAEQDNEQNAPSLDISLLMKGISPSNSEYYPSVVIGTLMKIVRDPLLSMHHTAAIQAIMHIFHALKLKCVIFLKDVIPGMIQTMKSSTSITLLEFYFQQLAQIIIIMKQHIRPYVSLIFGIIESRINNPSLQLTIVGVIESLSTAIEGDFKQYLPITLTLFLNILVNDASTKKIVSIRIMKSLVVFGSNMEEFAHLIIPTVIKLAEFNQGSLRKVVIVTIGKLSRSIKLNEMSPRIVHSLIRIVSSTATNIEQMSSHGQSSNSGHGSNLVSENNIIKLCLNTLCLLLIQMSSEFIVYVSAINKILVKHKIQHHIYEQLVSKLLNNEPLPRNLIVDKEYEDPNKQKTDTDVTNDKLPINQQSLKLCWDSTQQRTKEDWQEWLRRFSIQLLKESPSPALRACAPLGSIYYPLARELFNCSFSSCWDDLYETNQQDFLKSLNNALSSLTNPPEIHQVLLNLIEFMEHDEKTLDIPVSKLGRYAQNCHAFAKSLHYKEMEFIEDPTTETIESLININSQLHQTDAAIGILKHAQQYHDLQLKENWYERLQRWDDALISYEEKEAEGLGNEIEIMMGKMKAYHALGEWEQLSNLAEEKWELLPINIQRNIAPLAASASWGLGEWNVLSKYISVMKPHTPDKEFFDAILFLNDNNFDEASKCINSARDLLVTEISALVNESYSRSYNVVVRTQMIAELEEIMEYKKLPTLSEKKQTIRNTWKKRIFGVQKNVDVWQRILKVRSLVVAPKQDMDVWIKYANLCRKAGRLLMAQKALNSLLEDGGEINTARAPPPVVYAQLKFMWATGNQREALRYLINFTSRMAHDLGLNPSNMIAQQLPSSEDSLVAETNFQQYTKLLARCFMKQGEWRVSLQKNWTEENPDAILGSFLLATHFDNKWYKAWHSWALANFEVISSITEKLSRKSMNQMEISTALSSSKPEDESIESNENNEDKDVDEDEEILMIDGNINNNTGSMFNNMDGNIQENFTPELIQRHVIPAIKGFFHSISLSESNSLQDTLRLLTLWFTFGGISEVNQAIYDGFNLIKIDTWLAVIPQLISRIHQPNLTVSKALLSLLSDLGKTHPHALVYPLNVAIKSDSVSRQRAASSIIEKMRIHSPLMIEQAEMVSHELIRVAVLWHELWYEGLEDASRQFFGEHNTEKMFETLEPLHELLNKGPETLKEIAFQNSFARDLNDAYQWIMNYKRTKDVSNLNQAWDTYYNVFRRISRQLPQLQTLELQQVSPKLLDANNLILVLPGTYEADQEVVTINCFEPVLEVISSKQRPRRLTIRGNNGKEYQYSLKGHEDLRQDNLAMQLFGLVNTLLNNDSECFQRNLVIHTFSATSLSPKAGLIGWVKNSDTFHLLIRDYRESKDIPLSLEHKIMVQMAPDYDMLTLLEKVEVFEYALQNTKGQDLYKVLWLKSRSSESWLERRTTYTRSIAVMSMVGYILGLGDRHPSNLMLHRITGKVVHIDFGDCFEAAILRDKYPEKVPFRLTRMLTYAMEVSGVEGSFRITCENVMRVIRENKESLMAILEAFAYDPLINWGFDLSQETIELHTGIQLPTINTSDMLRNGEITAKEAARLDLKQKLSLRNARSSLVLNRINDKLLGNDFKRFDNLSVEDQVDKLIQEATNVENLCQHFMGWCSFW